jgi:transcription antitermination protein NusB
MLSRRVVRIKIMQLLYTMSRDESLTSIDATRRYTEYIQKTFEFYLLNVQYLIAVASYAHKDAETRKAKLRPLPEDEIFVPKLATNSLTNSLVSNRGLLKLINDYGIKALIKEDQVKKYYLEFAKTDDYRKYLLNLKSEETDHQDALLSLYRFLSSSETFNEDMEDLYFSWEDDKTLIVGAMKKTLKALPIEEDYHKEHLPDTEVTKDFGENLLKITLEKTKELMAIIEPNLRNWDVDRIAVLDLIAIKLGLIEFMDFPSIPTKVTLNEYVEISKLFSTDKSKEFVNGVLDRLLKKMIKDDIIKKEGRGLIE